MSKLILALVILFPLSGYGYNSMEQFADTIEYPNSGEPIQVINHSIAHYYYDSTCVWSIEYPELIGMKDLALQNEMNQIFTQAVSIGDCEDEECTPAEERLFPFLSTYTTHTKVNCIYNNIISYTLHWKSCKSSSKECSQEVVHVFYELNDENSGNRLSYFKQDSLNSAKLDELIISKLGFEPEDKTVLQRECELDFNCDYMSLIYDAYTLDSEDPLTITISYKELMPFISEEGTLFDFLK